jgi:hypothetical protein
MKITRRDVLLGATATAALAPFASRAQTSEVVIGVIYAVGRKRPDRRRCAEGVRDRGRHHQQEP